MMLAAILLFATASSIASQDASYDGSTLHLSGDVALDHSLGTMHAEKAVLTRQLDEKEEFPFACVELGDRVTIDLRADGTVSCDKAHFDFAALQGTAIGSVHLVDHKGGTPFEVRTPQLDLQLIKETHYTIQTATTTHGITLTLHQEAGPLTIEAPAATIRPTSIELHGGVTLSSDDIQGVATTLTYNPETKQCILQAEEGKKVLLARESDHLRMSAPEVHIVCNPETKLHEVHGIGHVVFSLSIEEETVLNQVRHHVSSAP